MPLIGSIVPIRNKLAYPAGIAPGFDPSHPASPGCYFSGIPGNKLSFLQIYPSPVQGVITAGGTSGIDSKVGPYYEPAAATGGASKIAFSITTPASNVITCAVIAKAIGTGTSNFLPTSIGPSGGAPVNGINAANGWGPRMGTTNNSVTPATIGIPYFFAFSAVGVAFQWVVVNLSNGSTQSGSSTSATSNAVSQAVLVVGNSPNGVNGGPMGIAAVMYSTALLSGQQLLAWAADPWAFWYPQRPPLWKGTAAAAAAFKAFWARPRNFIQPHGAAS